MGSTKVNEEKLSQNENAARQAAEDGVVVAVNALELLATVKDFLFGQPIDDLWAVSRLYLLNYGNWQELAMPEEDRKWCFQQNYGDEWEQWYKPVVL